MTYNPNGRFPVVEVPPLSPAEDLFTRGIEGPFIDTGYTIDFEQVQHNAHIYVSKSTVLEWADQLGILDDFRLQAEDAYISGHDSGYRAGLGENINGPVDDFIAHLELLLDTLRGSAPDPAAAGDPDVTADDGADDAGAGPKQRQPRKAARKPRPADVSDAPGAEPALSL